MAAVFIAGAIDRVFFLWHTLNKGFCGKMMRACKGQNLIEYAIIVALVTAAVAAMSTYVFRSVQATQKAVVQEFTD